MIQKINGGIKPGPGPGGLKLQEHGQDVRYRNVWMKELPAQKQTDKVEKKG